MITLLMEIASEHATLERDNRVRAGAQFERNGRLCCIIPSFNYGRFIETAIESVLAQTRPADEVIVIDDGSTDGTLEKLAKYASKNQGRVRVVRNQRNLGPAAARNRAIALTDCEYIISIDADDWCEPQYFETLTRALDEDPSLGVVYTGVKVWLNDASAFFSQSMNWPMPFSWEWMARRATPPRTCIPASAMYRREMWRRCGGFMESYVRGEDAEFWLRGLATGWGVRKVTDEALYVWRSHGISLSRGAYIDVHGWLPFLWRRDAPSGAPAPAAMKTQRDYTRPVISVIVTVGPGHARYVTSAIESVVGQTLALWELIVVNDSGTPLDLSRYPFARLVDIGTGNGASKARNAGLRDARASFVLFLDGDDFLHPFALQRLATAWAKYGDGYVYSDLFEYTSEGDDPRKGHAQARQLGEPDPGRLAMQCGITTLLRREDAVNIGGFDETMLNGWEDVDFYMRLRLAGVCAHHLPEPLFYYRQHSGTLRRRASEHRASLEALLDERYGEYKRGEKQMATCCGGDSGVSLNELKRGLQGLPSLPAASAPVEGKVKMQYIGSSIGGVTWFGKYYAGNNDTDRYIDADPADVDKLANTGMFARVDVLPVVEPATMPIVATEPPVDVYPVEPMPEPAIAAETMDDEDSGAEDSGAVGRVLQSIAELTPETPAPKRRGRK
jgi:glycosyltransferase involved in cell wall biosynthesis